MLNQNKGKMGKVYYQHGIFKLDLTVAVTANNCIG